MALRDAYPYPPPAVTTITAAFRANHNHHHATTYRQAARSMGLVLVGVTTDATCRTVATGRPGIVRAMGALTGVPPSSSAEMKNQFLELPHFSDSQASKNLTVST